MALPSIEDTLAIQSLYARYNLCSDAADAEGYAGCFAADGALHVDAVGFHLTGREALMAYKRADRTGRQNRYRRHWNNNLLLEVASDHTVLGRCYLLAYNGEPGKSPVMSECGVYEDVLTNASGEWLFLSRRLALDATTHKPTASGTEPEVPE